MMNAIFFTPAFLAAIDGDTPKTTWTPWGSTPDTLEQFAKSVKTPPEVPERNRLAFQMELIVETPDNLLKLDKWTNVVGAVIDLDSKRGKMTPDELHMKVCNQILAADSEAAPILAKRVGYHLRFLLSQAPTSAQERLMDLVTLEARDVLKSKGVLVETAMEIPSIAMFQRALQYVERRMRQIAR